VAAAVDLRLPTGREADLLGAGSASTRFSGIGSLERGRLSASGNAGVTVGGLATELNYDGAVAIAATPRVTIAGELLAGGSTAPAMWWKLPRLIRRSPECRRSG
jgi:hypothetical protein